MCKRYTLISSPAEIAMRIPFALPKEGPALTPRYNISPGEQAPVVIQEEGRNVCRFMRWGLVPFWAAGEWLDFSTFNAQSATIHTHPAFRTAFRRRRCLVPADGYYEWRREGGERRPYRYTLKEGRPFAFAGVWDSWRQSATHLIHSFAIIVAAQNEAVGEIGALSGAILHPGEYDFWLDPHNQDVWQMCQLLTPFPSRLMKSYAVGPAVNQSGFETRRCIQPLAT